MYNHLAAPTFSRPQSLALISNNTILCKCASANNVLYSFKFHADSTLELTQVLYVDHQLSYIKSATNNFFLGVSKSGNTLLLLNQSCQVLANIILPDYVTITALEYRTSTSQLVLAFRSPRSNTLLAVYQLTDRYELINIETLPIASEYISGIYSLTDNKVILSDCAEHKVSLFNLETSSHSVFATYGRDGHGHVRCPLSICFLNDLIAILDQKNYLIQFYSSSGQFLHQFGGKGSSKDFLDLPSDIICLRNMLLIADTNNDRLVLLSDLLTKPSASVLYQRNFLPGKLSRPISIREYQGSIYIADRSNGVIQVFDKNLNYIRFYSGKDDEPLSSPTSLCLIEYESELCMATLTRTSRERCPAILLHNPTTGVLVAEQTFPELSDPQGMTEANSNQLCVMDTLNRRALLLDNSLAIIKTTNLSSYSEVPRFLCRVPSLIEGNYYFTDYHTGITVVLTPEFNHLQTFELPLDKLGMSYVRRLLKIFDNWIVIGRGTHSIALVQGDLLEGSFFTPKSSIYHSVVDLCFAPTGLVYLLLKEDDSVVGLTYQQFLEFFI